MATFFYALLKTFDYTSVVLGQDSDDDAKAPHVAPIDKIWHARMGFTREQRTAMLASGVRADDIERQEASMVAQAAKAAPANGHVNGSANGSTLIPAEAFVSGRPKHTTKKSGFKGATDPEKQASARPGVTSRDSVMNATQQVRRKMRVQMQILTYVNSGARRYRCIGLSWIWSRQPCVRQESRSAIKAFPFVQSSFKPMASGRQQIIHTRIKIPPLSIQISRIVAYSTRHNEL